MNCVHTFTHLSQLMSERVVAPKGLQISNASCRSDIMIADQLEIGKPALPINSRMLLFLVTQLIDVTAKQKRYDVIVGH